MQYFIDSDCGKPSKLFKTTHGVEKTIELLFNSDGSTSYIVLKSQEKCRLKIGWKYVGENSLSDILNGKDREQIEIDEYCTKERVMNANDYITIPVGNSAKYSFGAEHGYRTVECFPMRIEILELVVVE